MHRTLNILDAEQARYRALNATCATAPLLHLDAQAEQDFNVPHLDADARYRAACNELAAGLDRLLSNATLVTATVAGIIGLGASAHVVMQYVGVALL